MFSGHARNSLQHILLSNHDFTISIFFNTLYSFYILSDLYSFYILNDFCSLQHICLIVSRFHDFNIFQYAIQSLHFLRFLHSLQSLQSFYFVTISRFRSSSIILYNLYIFCNHCSLQHIFLSRHDFTISIFFSSLYSFYIFNDLCSLQHIFLSCHDFTISLFTAFCLSFLIITLFFLTFRFFSTGFCQTKDFNEI